MHIDRKDLVQSLYGKTCLACGGPKQQRHTFCSECYWKLPKDLQRNLYNLINDGYEEAVSEALQTLGVTQPAMPFALLDQARKQS